MSKVRGPQQITVNNISNENKDGYWVSDYDSLEDCYSPFYAFNNWKTSIMKKICNMKIAAYSIHRCNLESMNPLKAPPAYLFEHQFIILDCFSEDEETYLCLERNQSGIIAGIAKNKESLTTTFMQKGCSVHTREHFSELDHKTLDTPYPEVKNFFFACSLEKHFMDTTYDLKKRNCQHLVAKIDGILKLNGIKRIFNPHPYPEHCEPFMRKDLAEKLANNVFPNIEDNKKHNINITGSTGSGKTQMSLRIGKQLKNKSIGKYESIFVNLNDLCFSKTKFEEEVENRVAERILEIMYGTLMHARIAPYKELKKNIEKNLPKATNKRLLIVLDGTDRIAESYKNEFSSMIEQISSESVNILTTCRSTLNMGNNRSLPFGFDLEESINYIRIRLEHVMKADNTIMHKVHKPCNNCTNPNEYNSGNHNIACIAHLCENNPKALDMLTSIFIEQVLIGGKSIAEFLAEQNPKLKDIVKDTIDTLTKNKNIFTVLEFICFLPSQFNELQIIEQANSAADRSKRLGNIPLFLKNYTCQETEISKMIDTRMKIFCAELTENLVNLKRQSILKYCPIKKMYCIDPFIKKYATEVASNNPFPEIRTNFVSHCFKEEPPSEYNNRTELIKYKRKMEQAIIMANKMHYIDKKNLKDEELIEVIQDVGVQNIPSLLKKITRILWYPGFKDIEELVASILNIMTEDNFTSDDVIFFQEYIRKRENKREDKTNKDLSIANALKGIGNSTENETREEDDEKTPSIKDDAVTPKPSVKGDDDVVPVTGTVEASTVLSNMLFLLSCDKRDEAEVSSLINNLERSDCRFIIKTFKNVPKDGKGRDFGEQLDRFLQFAKYVLIICSDNLGAFIDKNKTKNCPDIIKNEKKENCSVLLKRFLKKQMVNIPNKIIVISVNGNKDLPKCMAGVSIIEKKCNEQDFLDQIIAQIR